MSDFNTDILIPPGLGDDFSFLPTTILTLRQWNLLFFRVRSWLLTYSSSFIASDPMDVLYAHSATTSRTRTISGNPVTPTDELDLISTGFNGFSGGAGTYTMEDASTQDDTSAVVFGYNCQLSGLDLELSSYVNIGTPGFADAGSVDRTFGLDFTGDAYNTIQAASANSLLITNINGTGKTVSGSYSLTLVPNLFWGWGGKFDTTTGAPL